MSTTPTGKSGSPDGHEELSAAVLKEYFTLLLRYVRRRAKWMFGSADDLALGQETQDIVQEALLSLFDSTSGTQASSDPSRASSRWRTSLAERAGTYGRLVSFANSKLIALRRKLERRRKVGGELATSGSRALTALAAIIEDDQWMPSTAEELADFRPLHDAIVEAIIEDPQLVYLYDIAASTGRIVPQAVAKELGIDARDIENLKKKLRRRIEAAWDTLRCAAGGCP